MVPLRELAIKLSVTFSDESFDSSISMPVDSTSAQRKAFVEQWLKLMEAGLAFCREKSGAEKV